MNANTRTLDPGTVIDNRYEVVRQLGRGGFASVYLAHHLQLDRDVALKILDPITSGATDNFIDRFMSEARIVANIRHPNVVMIYDFGVVRDDQPYLAMEYLEGHDLEEELNKNGPMAPSRARGLFLGALDALQEGHEKSVVHKDLKPSNLYLVNPGQPNEKLMVLDYGIARVTDSEAPRLTQTGGYTGTPAYMPPEYIQHSIVAPSNDVYQMALIIGETLTGKQIVNAGTAVAYLVAHMGGQHQIDDWLANSQWGHVLTRALSVDHTQRYQDAGEFRRALAAASPPNVSAEIDPIGQTQVGSISEHLVGLASDGSDAAINVSHQTGPAKQLPTPKFQAIEQGVVPGQKPSPKQHTPRHVPKPAHTASSAPTQQDPAPLPATQPEVQPYVPQPAHGQPAHVLPAHVPQPYNHGYAHYQKPRKKRRWPWVLLFLFLFSCLALVLAPVAVIWGYYGGWDGYMEAVEAWGVSQVEEAVPDDLPNVSDWNNPIKELSNLDNPMKLALSMSPHPEAQKISSYMKARYMVYHTLHQIDVLEVSVENYGFSDHSRLMIPTGTKSMMDTGIQFLDAAVSLSGGSSELDQHAKALMEDISAFNDSTEALVDYYEVEEAYEQDGGKKGKTLVNNTITSSARLQKSFQKFHKGTEKAFTEYFQKCKKTKEGSDMFLYHACDLMLASQRLSLSAFNKAGMKHEEQKFQASLKRYKKYVRSHKGELSSRYSFGTHNDFTSNAEEFLDEAREWRRKKPFGAPKGKRPMPQAPFFVFMDRDFMFQTFLVLLGK